MKLHNTLMTVATLAAMMAWTASAFAQENGEAAATDGATIATGGVAADCGSGCVAGHCGGGHAGCGCRAGYNDGNCYPRAANPCPPAGPSTDCIGAVGPLGCRYLGPVNHAALAARDHYSPEPFYAYGPRGLDATRTDHWNRHMAGQTSWHGGYSYWRYGQPTALVVPPTAAFQTEYNWGVAQTRSLPIYAQFSGQAGVIGASAGPGVFPYTPYRPSSTNQFGIYPVRAPW